MRLGVVLVHYHTPELLTSSVMALRQDILASDIDAEWRLVDNGSTAQEQESLRRLELPVLESEGNVGFAAAVNRGVECCAADNLLILNPDVRVEPGCVTALLRRLEAGAGAAAPRLYWDQQRRFLLPPGEQRTRRDELLALLGRRRPHLCARARRRWRRSARRHWQATGDFLSYQLSGAVIAVSRKAWKEVGPFDEGYRMYFEETDWLRRLRKAGLPAYQVSEAVAVHDFAQSSKSEPRSRGWFEESSRRYRRSSYGAWFDAVYTGLSASGPGLSPLDSWQPWSSASAVAAGGRAAWVELSPNPEAFPAAAERLGDAGLDGWRAPCTQMAAIGAKQMSLCVTDAGGAELGLFRLSA